jgi:hypothetical protein
MLERWARRKLRLRLPLRLQFVLVLVLVVSSGPSWGWWCGDATTDTHAYECRVVVGCSGSATQGSGNQAACGLDFGGDVMGTTAGWYPAGWDPSRVCGARAYYYQMTFCLPECGGGSTLVGDRCQCSNGDMWTGQGDCPNDCTLMDMDGNCLGDFCAQHPESCFDCSDHYGPNWVRDPNAADYQCCLDDDGNGLCDRDQPYPGYCADQCCDPMTDAGDGSCCLDQDGNGECDVDDSDCDAGYVLYRFNSQDDYICCEDSDSNGTCDFDEISQDCPSGYTWISGRGCVLDSEDPTCPSGQTLDQYGRCVQSVSCPEGSAMRDGVCVSDGSEACPEGTRYEAGECVSEAEATCPAGTVLRDGRCVPEDNPAGDCPEGYVRATDGSCSLPSVDGEPSDEGGPGDRSGYGSDPDGDHDGDGVPNRYDPDWGRGTSADSGGSGDESDVCESNPDLIQCQEIGSYSPGDEPEIPVDEVEMTFAPERSDSGSCPAAENLEYMGQAVVLSWQPVCDFASALRPLVLAVTGIVTLWFVARGLGS